MKKLILILLLLIFSTTCLAGSGAIKAVIARKNAAGGGCAYDMCETFETTPGADQTWTDDRGTPNYDFSTAGIGLFGGAECLALDDNATWEAASTEGFTAAAEIYVSFKISVSDGQPAGPLEIFNIRDSANNKLAYISLRDVTGSMRMYATGGSYDVLVDNSAGTDPYVLSDGPDSCCIQIRYKKGTGANAEVQGWVDDTCTFSGAYSVTVSDGTGVADADDIYFLQPSIAYDLYVDDINVHSSKIADY